MVESDHAELAGSEQRCAQEAACPAPKVRLQWALVLSPGQCDRASVRQAATQPHVSEAWRCGAARQNLAAHSRRMSGHSGALEGPDQACHRAHAHSWARTCLAPQSCAHCCHTEHPRPHAVLSSPAREAQSDISANCLSWFGPCCDLDECPQRSCVIGRSQRGALGEP